MIRDVNNTTEQYMKRILSIIIAAVVAIGVADAKNWCETLVNSLNVNSDVDKSVAVNRDPKTHEITKATYDFRFSSGKLYDQICNTMKTHAADADYYSETGDKNKIIIMRVSDNGRLWSCKLQKLGRNSKQFLVTVNTGGDEKSTITILSPSESREVQRQTKEAVRQAQQAAREAQQKVLREQREVQQKVLREQHEAQQKVWREQHEAQQKAWREQREAQQKAWREQHEARQKAWREQHEAQQKALKAQPEAIRTQQAEMRAKQKAQREAWKSRGRSTSSKTVKINNTTTSEKAAAINSHNQELKKAEAERKRKLAQ